MSYRNIRLLISISCALITLVTTVVLGVLLLSARDALLVLPILAIFGALITFFIVQGVVGLLLHPLSILVKRAKTLSEGDYSVRFMDKQMENQAPKLIQDLAQSLEKVGSQVRTTMAELVSESRRQKQFISDVSHEMRTPLTSIRGAAETMLDEDISYEDRENFCLTIVSEADRLTRLANDLITLQRIEGDGDLALKRVNLHTVIEHALNMLDILFEERGVSVSLSGEAPDVLGDADRLQQVVVNLLDNGSRYVSNGGRIHVELSGVHDHSVVTFSDDGPGFGDIDPSRLFDRFYRGERSRVRTSTGYGLGLTIVKAIVAAHDGTVEAVNLPGGGACFIVAIPSLPPQ
ncbi:MAG: HAMP domain-containing histidine kinase [Coriobacteriales bacterium]|jgi:two-component system OmpR family sensor kinase|nr:HAMP domain-containing histidine kinase [Coriobacteriales bacterium]